MPSHRLAFGRWPSAVYAIGDIHGCYAQFLALEAKIIEDAASAGLGTPWIVTLGDHIDRGPNSAAVIEHMLAPPPAGFLRLGLRGNHDQVMLDFLRDPAAFDWWLGEGGLETLASYGIDLARAYRTGGKLQADIGAHLPAAHLEFLAGLPYCLSLPGWLFVHAGIRPGLPLDRQSDEDLIWIREPFLSGPATPGLRVVHGHTPTVQPTVTAARIGIDTRCFATGRLTALRVTPDGATKFLATG